MSVSERLEEAREILLDLSKGNRLLNYRPLRAQGLDFVDAVSADVHRRLVREKKPLTFLPAPDEPSAESTLVSNGGDSASPAPIEPEGATIAPRVSPNSLQTNYEKKVLEKRLLRSSYVFNNYMSEQGVNVLYMACGFLKWYEADATDIPQQAPLILVPVSLQRSSARTGYRVTFTGDEMRRNLSLEAKMRELWGVDATKLPDIGDNPEDLDVEQYLSDVEELVKGQKRWKVSRDKVALGFFSFGKFLLYNDLDRNEWPNGEMPHTHDIIGAILGVDGFPQNRSDLHLDSDRRTDWLTESDPGMHVVDADSSQVEALDLVRNGSSLVIKGPPGTGKSQTITNIIAQAIYDGKKVLFVSAKMAALDVVKRNLAKVGLDNACLELHSRKKAKKLVVNELKDTYGSQEPDAIIKHNEELARLQALARTLNEHSKLVNTPIQPSGVPLIDAYGEMLRLKEIEKVLGQEFRHVHEPVSELAEWSRGESRTRENIVREFQGQLGQMGAPNEHLFWPSKRVEFTPFIPAELRDLAEATQNSLAELTGEAAKLADCLNVVHPDNLEIIEKCETEAKYLIQAPDLGGLRIDSDEWLQSKDVIVGLIKIGGRYRNLRRELLESLSDDAFAYVPQSGLRSSVEVKPLREALEQLNRAADSVAKALNLSYPNTVSGFRQVRRDAERIVDPPSLKGIDTDNTEWLSGSEKILSIIESGRRIRRLRDEYQSALKPSAWGCDLTGSAEILQNHGKKWWRFLNIKFHQAVEQIRELNTEDVPYSVTDLLQVAAVIGEAQEHQTRLEEYSETATKLFGSKCTWRDTEWDRLQEVTEWLAGLYRDCERGDHQGAIIGVVGQLEPETLDKLIAGLAGAFGTYDAIVESLNALFLDTAPESVQEQIHILAKLEELQRCRRTLNESEGLLGQLIEDGDWLADDFNWDMLAQGTSWLAELHALVGDGTYRREHLSAISQTDFPEAARQNLEHVDATRTEFLKKLDCLCGFIEIEAADAFPNGESLAKTTWDVIEGRLKRWIRSPELLNEVVQYNLAVAKLRANGLEWISAVASNWEYADRHLTDLLKHHRYRAIVERAYAIYAELSTFNGYQHNERIGEFIDADRELLQANPTQIAWRHWGKFQSTVGEGEMGVLLKEFHKRARHLPVRKLLEKAGNAIQMMKPVFMMGPVSIPAFLPRRQDMFDLVVFDEASQVEPVDAFGAIVRGKQLVVVGDQYQLPPTRFFEKVADGQDEDFVGDIESILGYCLVAKCPHVMLRWHYRSLHESLISVSNAEFYKKSDPPGLVVFSSPSNERGELGLQYRHLPDTVYESGRDKAFNDGEAEQVALAVRSFAKEQLAKDKEDRYTLGVAAFGQPQTEHIEDHIERLRQTDREFDKFCSEEGIEPFFVKNLENVQGDERDVIYISIGYGRQESGKVNHAFGPLSHEGGERRLNVLITRARRKCVVFTNMNYTDIDLTRIKKKGVQVLKRFLQYAETGELNLPIPTGDLGDSPFEDAVAMAIEGKLGYTVVQQVSWQGGSPKRGEFGAIDIGVKDPDRPGAYILGIECDGATYHRTRAARDRDRLKKLVLEGRGWRIHRIWSTDWFNNPERELGNLRDLLDAIRAGKMDGFESDGKSNGAPARLGVSAPSTGNDVETDSVSKLPGSRGLPQDLVDYHIAEFDGQPSDKNLRVIKPNEVARMIARVVEIESPVHKSEVRKRILAMVADTRTSPGFNVSFDKGLTHAVAQELVVGRDEFLWRYDMAQSPLGMCPIRNRRKVPTARRDIRLIAPEEIQKAIFTLVQKSVGVEEREIPRVVVRWLGYRAISSIMREYVATQVAALVRAGTFIRDGEGLHLPESYNN